MTARVSSPRCCWFAPRHGFRPRPAVRFRRLARGRRPSASDVSAAGGAPDLTAGATANLESELAERLDSLLGIAERLAATHDRERPVPDDRRRDATGAPRRLRHDPHPASTTVSMSPRGPACTTTSRPPCPCSASARAGSARCCAPDGSAAWSDVRVDRRLRRRAVRRRRRVRGRPDRAAHPSRSGHRRPVRRDPRAARLDATATSRS